MAKSTLVAPSTTSARASAMTPSNILSRLPPELRHIVYSYLNFPIGGHTWIDCPSHRTCTHASHIIFRAEANWLMRCHANKGVFEVRRRIEKLQLSNAYPNLRGLYAQIGSGKDKTWIRGLTEWNLFGVNKEIRKELMDLVFGGNEVELDGWLIRRPIFRRVVREPYTMPCISLLCALAHMTSVTIPGYFLCDLQLMDNCQSIQCIATYATNLRHLTLFLRSSYLASTEAVMPLVQTIRTVTVTAKKLETLRFMWEELNLTIFQDWNPRECEMTLDKSKWGRVVLEF